MKIAVFVFIALSLMSVVSCTKNSNTTNPVYYGTFSLKGVNYKAATMKPTGNGTLTGTTDASGNVFKGASIILYFPNQTLPTAAGPVTYTVTKNYLNPPANQIAMAIDTAGVTTSTYVATGGDGIETVSVSVSPAGKVTVVGSNITVCNGVYTHSPDTTKTFSLNITQQ